MSKRDYPASSSKSLAPRKQNVPSAKMSGISEGTVFPGRRNGQLLEGGALFPARNDELYSQSPSRNESPWRPVYMSSTKLPPSTTNDTGLLWLKLFSVIRKKSRSSRSTKPGPDIRLFLGNHFYSTDTAPCSSNSL